MKTSAATVENSVAAPLKIKRGIITWEDPSIPHLGIKKNQKQEFAEMFMLPCSQQHSSQ
jgi:hypothetical protein